MSCGRCGHEIARLRRLAAASCDFEANPLVGTGGSCRPRSKNLVISDPKETRKRLCALSSKRLKSDPKATFCQKNSRRLELSISKNTLHGRLGQGPRSVDQRFAAGLPFPVPEILEFVAFRDSREIFQQYSRDFPGVFLGNPRTHPTNSHSLLEFSDFDPQTSLAASVFFFVFARPAKGKKHCDFCSGMAASPLAATVVTAILRCDFCAAEFRT